MAVVGQPHGRFRPLAASLLAVLFLSGATLFPINAHSQQKAVLWVRVFDIATGKPVAGAEVTFMNTQIRMVTDRDGEFGIELNGGKYTLSIVKVGYYNSFYSDVWVEPGEVTRIRCEMAPGDPNERFYFGIGGINIIGKKDLLPEKAATTYEITSAEIEHNLSTNLGDVLTLIPGVERTEAPGLARQQLADVRGAGITPGVATNPGASDSRYALLGTKIIVDDINVSNNANLQTGTGTSYGSVKNYAGTGIDLRTIPADNIKKVEVVTGLPSVEYGDLVSGLVKVETKSEGQPHRFKFKSNPDTKEGNLSGAWKPRGTSISYNLNYAYSERNVRREGDEFYRYSGQLVFKNKFRNERVLMSNRFYYTGVQDETNTAPDDPLSVEQYNRDKTYVYGNSLDFIRGEKTRFEWRASIRYTNRDSYKQKLTGADTRVLSDATETGTQEAEVKAGSYLYKIWTKGEEWNLNARVNFKRQFVLFGLGNALLVGGEYTYDDNVGEGKIFNPLEPPEGALGRRPLPFDAVPAMKSASLYAEDDIKGFLFKRPYTLTLGFRYDMYTPSAFNWDGIWSGDKEFVESRNGSFFNPRVNLLYAPWESTRFRFGWGRSSKMPPMTSIFNGPEYIDVVEENVTPPDSTPLISTYVYQFDNSDLDGYQSEKAELAVDQKIGSAVLTATGFYQRADGIPYTVKTPIVLHRYRWENWPDPASRTVLDTLYLTGSSGTRARESVGWYGNYGLELDFKTSRVKSISTVFRVSASYVHSTTGADGTYMYDPRTVSALGGRTIYPFYSYREGWKQRMIVNYSADWFAKPLGLWITFFLQQTLFDANQNLEDPDAYASAYYDPIDDQIVPLTQAGSDSLGLTRSFEDRDILVWKRPNDRLLFNVNVTKSLGRGTELSFFVHNFFDDAAFYLDPRNDRWDARNHNIFYGIEVSVVMNRFFASLSQ
jgi:outer membrane receptor for ferrienterochelin and colicin